jgi:hypothetical protein
MWLVFQALHGQHTPLAALSYAFKSLLLPRGSGGLWKSPLHAGVKTCKRLPLSFVNYSATAGCDKQRILSLGMLDLLIYSAFD